MSIVHNSFDHHKAPARMRHLIGKVLRHPGKSLYKPREAGRAALRAKARMRAVTLPEPQELQTADFESLRAIAAVLDERGYPCRPGR